MENPAASPGPRSRIASTSPRSGGETRSSASRQRTQSFRAARIANSFWATCPGQSRSITRAPARAATSRVRSLEWESTTRISSAKAAEAGPSPSRSSSWKAITLTESGIRPIGPSVPEDFPVDPLGPLRHRRRGEECGHPLAARLPHPRARRGVPEESVEGLRQRRRVLGRDEEARPAREDRLPETPNLRGDDGAPRPHRLEDGDAEPLEPRRRDEEVAGGEQVRDVAALAEEEDPVLQSERPAQVEEAPALGARPGEEETRVGPARPDRGEGAEEGRLVLPRPEASRAEYEGPLGGSPALALAARGSASGSKPDRSIPLCTTRTREAGRPKARRTSRTASEIAITRSVHRSKARRFSGWREIR